MAVRCGSDNPHSLAPAPDEVAITQTLRPARCGIGSGNRFWYYGRLKYHFGLRARRTATDAFGVLQRREIDRTARLTGRVLKASPKRSSAALRNHRMTTRTPLNAALLRPEILPHHERGGGVTTIPLVTRALGGGFISGYTSFKAGAEVPFHSHNCAESIVLMDGLAILDIDGQQYELKPHDVTYIPAGISHRFRNASKTATMTILWIYADANATRTVTATGASHPVETEHGNTARTGRPPQ